MICHYVNTAATAVACQCTALIEGLLDVCNMRSKNNLYSNFFIFPVRNPQGLDLLDPPLTCHSSIATGICLALALGFFFLASDH